MATVTHPKFTFLTEEQLQKIEDRILKSVESKIQSLVEPLLAAQKGKPSVEEELLTPKEAAELMKCSKDTLRRRTKDGLIKNHGLGRSVRYSRSELLSQKPTRR